MEEPTTIYSEGTVIEDQNAVLKIERFQKDRNNHHLYYCHVLKWKIEPPPSVKTQYEKDKLWIWVRPESINNITVIE